MVDVIAVETTATERQVGPSWGSIFAGAAASVALTILLLTLAAGVGFSTVSPWPGTTMSAQTFGIVTGLYLIVMAMLASTIGGFLAGRLRPRSSSTGDEVYFRDTAHGLVTWALATIVTVGILGSTLGSLAGGAASALSSAASAAGSTAAANASDGLVDTLLRPGPNTPPASGAPNASGGDLRAEIGRMVTRALSPGGAGLTAADKTYAAQVIAARTGLSQADAERRIDDTINQALATADAARKTAATLSLWFAAALLVGAFSASLAAAAGGRMRDE
ncbi:hypothetical protein [Chelatococcus reniformis]|uniref:PhnA-like protein n=1 Tax=Chelatococcus reniformis TaxID=1494448 RepID=A0A916XLV6_9HYPH|nr:hypothetical protein [Chelatococcus reniformis]GGC81326.1 hypothetical protein GCM10010994_44130 [Chelatococcus reniformis]